MLKKSASFVLVQSLNGDPAASPLGGAHNLVLLIRRTVRPRGYASVPHSLRPCWTAFLNILQGCSYLV